MHDANFAASHKFVERQSALSTPDNSNLQEK